MSDLKLGHVSVTHPDAQERARGTTSRANLQLWTTTGRDRSIELSEDDLIRLIEEAAKVLSILRRVSR